MGVVWAQSWSRLLRYYAKNSGNRNLRQNIVKIRNQTSSLHLKSKIYILYIHVLKVTLTTTPSLKEADMRFFALKLKSKTLYF